MLDQILLSAERASLVQNCRTALFASFEAAVDGDFASNVTLVVNATPIGQKNDELPLPMVRALERVVAGSRSATFVDLVYSRSATPLCRMARELGFARVEDGTEMLIHQARLAFNIWTGHVPDGELARQRLK
jgi:shikimate 5-dehydrogenase